MSIRILHTADTHLGFKQYGFEERKVDFEHVVGDIMEKASELDANVVTLSGDLFQTNRPPGSAVDYLRSCIDGFRQGRSDRYVLGVEGNHDSADRKGSWLRVCGVTPVDMETMPEGFQLDGVTISGLDHRGNSGLRTGLQNLRETIDPDVILLHATLAEMAGFPGDYLDTNEIASLMSGGKCRLVLLGDIHDYKEMETGGIRFINPGSTEVTKSDEQREKSFSLIDISQSEVSTEVHPVSGRKFVDVSVESEEDLDKLRDLPENTMAIVSYNPDIPDIKKRATSFLEPNSVLYRLVPVKSGEDVVRDIYTQIGQQTFERGGAMAGLKEVLESWYDVNLKDDAGTDKAEESELVMACLDNPSETEKILGEYCREHGIKI